MLRCDQGAPVSGLSTPDTPPNGPRFCAHIATAHCRRNSRTRAGKSASVDQDNGGFPPLADNPNVSYPARSGLPGRALSLDVSL